MAGTRPAMTATLADHDRNSQRSPRPSVRRCPVRSFHPMPDYVKWQRGKGAEPMPTASVECRQDRRTRGTLRATLPILLLMLALDAYPPAASEQARMAPVATSAARKAQAAKAVD